MVIIHGMMGHTISAKEMKNMVVPLCIDPETYAIALKVEKVLKCDISSIIGEGAHIHKMLCIHLEIMINESVSPHSLAKKYNIDVDVMMNKLAGLQNRYRTDKGLLKKTQMLSEAFADQIK